MVLLALLSFCVQTRRIERKERERKEGLVRVIEAEAHIWVIGDDRPWIIPPDNRTSERWRGCPNPMEFVMRHSIVTAWKNSC